jgi:hypothetical protein
LKFLELIGLLEGISKKNFKSEKKTMGTNAICFTWYILTSHVVINNKTEPLSLALQIHAEALYLYICKLFPGNKKSTRTLGLLLPELRKDASHPGSNPVTKQGHHMHNMHTIVKDIPSPFL